MKPRIKRGMIMMEGRLEVAFGWHCTSRGAFGSGPTPTEAYSQWYRAMIASGRIRKPLPYQPFIQMGE